MTPKSPIPCGNQGSEVPLRAYCVLTLISFPPTPPWFPRDLDARAKNECYRATFRLPRDERLDGHTGCTLWTPFNKLHIPGQMFISSNYICFASKEEDACHLIIPLREVSPQCHASSTTSGGGPAEGTEQVSNFPEPLHWGQAPPAARFPQGSP